MFTVGFGNLQGAPSVPQRMGELGRIDAMATGHLAIRGLDLMGDVGVLGLCLLYTSDAADERSSVDLGGRRIIKKKTRGV